MLTQLRHRTLPSRVLVTTAVALAALVGLQGSALAQADDLSSESVQEAKSGKNYTTAPLPVQSFRHMKVNLPDKYTRAIVQDSLGMVWFGTQSGLSVYAGPGAFRNGARAVDARQYKHKSTDGLESDFITALAAGDKGDVWIGTGEGFLSHYSASKQAFINVEGLGERSGINILIRVGDTIWGGTQEGHVIRIDIATGEAKIAQASSKDEKSGEIVFDSLGDSIVSMAAGPKGHIYAATQGGEVFDIDPAKTEEIVDTLSLAGVVTRGANGTANVTLSSVFLDGEQNLWIGTKSGLFRSAKGKDRFEQVGVSKDGSLGITDPRVSFIYEDSTGSIWVGTENGLNQFQRNSLSPIRYERNSADESSIVHHNLTVAFEDKGGLIWFGHFDNGVSTFEHRREALGHQKLDIKVDSASFLEEADGTVWIGTYPGSLRRYSADGTRVDVINTVVTRDAPEGFSLEGAWITDIVRGKDGLLWFSTQGLGLFAYNDATGSADRYFDNEDANGLGTNDVFWITEKNGLFYLATWGLGLKVLNPQTRQFSDFEGELKGVHIYSIVADKKRKNVLWLGMGEGLSRIDVETLEVAHYAHDEEAPEGTLSSNLVPQIYQADSDDFWIGTFGGGLNHFDPKTKVFTAYGEEAGILDDEILGIAPDNSGNIWLSTNGAGLVRFNLKERKGINFTIDDGASNEQFSQGAVHLGLSGKLYFGGKNGHNIFIPKDVKRYTYSPAPFILGFGANGESVTDTGKPAWIREGYEMSYKDSGLVFRFAQPSFAGRNRFMYKLDGSHDWIETEAQQVSYPSLKDGDYTFRVKAANHHGVWSDVEATTELEVTPPWWFSKIAYGGYLLILIMIALTYMRFQNQKVEKAQQETRLAAVEREIELTGVVQNGFMPDTPTYQHDQISLYGFNRPAEVCGGDWWWYEETDTGDFIVLVGDVTGHGVAPAMVTAAVASAFRAMANEAGMNLDRRIEKLNEEVSMAVKGNLYMTLTAIHVDAVTGDYRLYSAGGTPPLSVVPGRQRAKALICQGTPLGNKDFELGHMDGTLVPGERLVVFTDGIPEIMTQAGKLLGMRKFQAMCQKTAEMPLNASIAQLVKESDVHRAGVPQDDDWTVVMLGWAGDSGAEPVVTTSIVG